MNYNDTIIRLRYALNLSNQDVIRLFAMGGVKITQKDLDRILTKQEDDSQPDQALSAHDLEAFLNGLVIDKRGERLYKDGQVVPPTFDMTKADLVNNVAIKKIKIAMAYTSDDLQQLLALAGAKVSNGELSAILRRPDHRNYRPAGDRYLRKLLAGMGKKYR
ncbi:DUF1456 family protein [Fructobacillus evanidus]|uniref:DUF1456 family (YehS) n=1 Tax=Fructobacillus evanidus TaxID=3064281 RepID=A0ABM9N188_9LACO|nr:DUF1456 family (YehS) [Fructobacillus sp. LMG 32999]CAK1248124.1 DUF1456 family (YehS) [Fructobacillus sp. LMG 32999]CAK1252505.1 DUF1456 family (YehS) [Fructobacillus sp. LMG 32999]CAK1252530.1 DUF1456 family (YehS) [Fructobacillus sp. LMG 32999]CAK1252643.1 DUF1456 family (YehS) [Fructobacillus sp. LMG 32999]